MAADNPADRATDAGPSVAGRATARDVARAAGVSEALVSYAFNRPDRVAAATRERVLATAATIGYRGPDAGARALRLGRRRLLGLHGTGGIEGLLADPAGSEVARGIARACDATGLALVLADEDGPVLPVDAVVLWRGASAGWGGASPAIAVDPATPVDLPHVGAEVEGAAGAAGAHLAAAGCERLAILTWPEAGSRLAGARRGWGDAGPIRAYEVADATRTAGEAAARAALRATPRPDAILGLCDELALGALDAVRHTGARIPEEVAVAGIDDLPGAGAAGLTSVFVPYLPFGELAARTALALIHGDPPPDGAPLPTSLAIRASTTGPPPATSPRARA